MSYPIRGVRSGFCSSFPRGATVTDLAAEREYAVLNWRKILRLYAVAVICLAALVASGCAGSESSPTAPSSTDAAPPAEPGSPGRMSVSISPNPVPWSGAAVSGCNLANRWHYEQVLTNTGGTTVTVSDRVDFFNGTEVRRRADLGIVLEPGAEARIATEWCSSNNIEHRAQTNFSGSDAGGNPVTVAGTTVRLQPK
jgi:hypothetical protein